MDFFPIVQELYAQDVLYAGIAMDGLNAGRFPR
jgi:hypothetical protein